MSIEIEEQELSSDWFTASGNAGNVSVAYDSRNDEVSLVDSDTESEILLPTLNLSEMIEALTRIEQRLAGSALDEEEEVIKPDREVEKEPPAQNSSRKKVGVRPRKKPTSFKRRKAVNERRKTARRQRMD